MLLIKLLVKIEFTSPEHVIWPRQHAKLTHVYQTVFPLKSTSAFHEVSFLVFVYTELKWPAL